MAGSQKQGGPGEKAGRRDSKQEDAGVKERAALAPGPVDPGRAPVPPEEPESYRVGIKSLPEEVRPRERMARLGPEALSDAELLAIILRTGWAEESALELAHRLLAQPGVGGIWPGPAWPSWRR